ncbi:N-acetyltransferase [Dictyobacter sp. S3.2.2.5]|uniref:N-acetyltransferase n=1 Tax=Dictyobacter halimunensis TaxID=3026934 RepID=A0ABQ6FRB4_9CHLR|nr:N-acetyltransferase [Dictyobacter sp. S3.2.2.5]
MHILEKNLRILRLFHAKGRKDEERHVEISKAVPQDAALIKQIMLASKAHWGYSENWIAAWGNHLTISPAYIRENDIYIARENPQSVLGFHGIKLHEKGLCERLELWVIPQRIGTGIGRLLFLHALEMARALGASEMQWEADPHAVGFYHHMGAYHIREIDSKLEGQRLPVMGIKIASSAFSSGVSAHAD